MKLSQTQQGLLDALKAIRVEGEAFLAAEDASGRDTVNPRRFYLGAACAGQHVYDAAQVGKFWTRIKGLRVDTFHALLDRDLVTVELGVWVAV